jgi:hypothetical protein
MVTDTLVQVWETQNIHGVRSNAQPGGDDNHRAWEYRDQRVKSRYMEAWMEDERVTAGIQTHTEH